MSPLLFRKQLTALGVLLVGIASAMAAPSLTLSSQSFYSDSVGWLTHTITGINPGETVTIERIADFNRNGAIDPKEPVYRAFSVTDGVRPIIGGVVNGNVHGDDDGTVDGNIRVDLPFPGVEPVFGSQVGAYIIRVISASGQASRPFEIVDQVQPQWINGRVTYIPESAGTGVPYATLAVSYRSRSLLTSVRTDAAGYFAFFCRPDAFAFAILPREDMYSLFGDGSVGTLAPHQFTFINMQAFAPTVYTPIKTISGKVIDAQTQVGLRSVIVGSPGGVVSGVGGSFSFPVAYSSSGTIRAMSSSLSQLGYVGDLTGVAFTSTSGSFPTNLKFAKATSLIYGRALNQANIPVANLVLRARSLTRTNQEAYGRTSANGDYFLGVNEGEWQIVSEEADLVGFRDMTKSVSVGANVSKQVDISLQRVTAHILGTAQGFSDYFRPAIQAFFEGSASPTVADVPLLSDGSFRLPVWAGKWTLNVASNSPVYIEHRVDVTVVDGVDQNVSYVMPANNGYIPGLVQDGFGKPAGNMRVHAEANIDGGAYAANTQTDTNGYYALHVPPGTWTVSLNCEDVEKLHAVCPPSQFLPASGFLRGDFTLLPNPTPHLNGRVVDQTGVGRTNVALIASVAGGAVPVRGSSGPDGTFSLELLGPGEWSLTTMAAPVAGEINPTMHFSITDGSEVSGIAYTIFKTDGVIEGSVRNAAQQALGGLEVRARLDGSVALEVTSRTDPLGNFSISVPRISGLKTLPNCTELLPLVYDCPAEQSLDVSSGFARADFVVTTLPPLTEPPRLKGGTLIPNGGSPIIEFVVEGRSRTYEIVGSPPYPFVWGGVVGTVTVPVGETNAVATVVPGPYQFFRIQSR